MGITGKYNFKGIKKASALAIFTAIAASPAHAITNGISGKILMFLLESACNWLANRGLVLLNVGADFIYTLKDEKELDNVMDQALAEVHGTKTRLTEEQKKAIDDKVIAAFEPYAVYSKLRK